MTKSFKEKGVGLIEVMIALVVLMVAAGAIVNMQSNSLVSAHSSGTHFSIDHLSSEMIEILRSNSSDAAEGLLNFSTAENSSSSSNDEVKFWNERVVELLPSGEGTISCTSDFCDVTVSWLEEIDGSNRRQFYNTRTKI